MANCFARPDSTPDSLGGVVADWERAGATFRRTPSPPSSAQSDGPIGDANVERDPIAERDGLTCREPLGCRACGGSERVPPAMAVGLPGSSSPEVSELAISSVIAAPCSWEPIVDEDHSVAVRHPIATDTVTGGGASEHAAVGSCASPIFFGRGRRSQRSKRRMGRAPESLKIDGWRCPRELLRAIFASSA